MTARLLAFVIWAAVAATAVFWGLRLVVQSPAAPPHTLAAGTAVPRGDLTRLFGADPPPVAAAAAPVPQAASRYKLIGVVAPKPGSVRAEGVALISVDEKPARAFRVGAPIDGSTVLQSVHKRGASLGPRGAPAEVQLELPPPTAPATGNLPPPMAVDRVAPPPPVPPPAVMRPEAPQQVPPPDADPQNQGLPRQ